MIGILQKVFVCINLETGKVMKVFDIKKEAVSLTKSMNKLGYHWVTCGADLTLTKGL